MDGPDELSNNEEHIYFTPHNPSHLLSNLYSPNDQLPMETCLPTMSYILGSFTLAFAKQEVKTLKHEIQMSKQSDINLEYKILELKAKEII